MWRWIEDEEELIDYGYSDILEKENPVAIGYQQEKKKNYKIEQEQEKEIILIGEILNPYKKTEENLFGKDIEKIL